MEELKEELYVEIEDHKRTKEEISEERNKLQSILGAMQNGVTIRDLDYTLTYQNDIVTKLYGDRTGEKCYRVFEGREQICEGCPVELAFKDGQSHTSIRERVLPSGETTYWENTANPVRDANGKIVSCLEVCTNITEQKKAERQLHFLSSITEQVADGVIMTDLNYRMTYVNLVCQQVYGYSEDELLGQSPGILHAGPNSKQIQKDIYETVSSGNIWRGEAENRRKDGSRFPCELTIFPLKNDDGDIFAYAGIQRDITKRKRAEEALRDSEERFRTSVENMLDCFGIYTAIRDESGGIVDFRIEYVNKAACVNNHMTKEEQIGKRLLELLPAHRETGLFDMYCQVVETDKPLVEESLIYEDVYKKKHLTRVFDIRVVKLSDGFAAAWRDVTERKQAEEALKKSQGLLAETERVGKVGGWEFNIDTEKQIWTQGTYKILELDLAYEPTVEKGVNFYTPASRPIIERAVQRAIEHGEPFDVELEIMTAKGNLRSVHAIGKADLEHRRVYGFFQDITERKRAEEALRNEKLLSEEYINSLPGLFYVFDEERFVRWNKQWEKVTGYSAKELATKYGTDFFEGNDRTLVGERMLEVFCDGVSEAEAELVTKDGRRIPHYFTGLRKKINGKDHLIGLGIDITKRKKAEDALNKSEQEYRSTLNDLLVGVVVHASDSSILLSNPEATNILGLTHEQMMGKKAIDPAWNFVREDSTILKVEDYPVSRVLSTKKPLHDYILGVKRPDKDHITWVIVNAIPVFANDSEVEKVVVNFVDISERKQAEDTLKKSEGLLAETERVGKVGGWEFNIDTGKQIWTQETYHIHELDLAYEPTVEKGVNFYTPASRPIIERAVQRAIEHGEPFDVELEIITAKGNLRSVHAIGKVDFEQRKVYGFFQDITERKKAEQKLKASEGNYQQLFESMHEGFALCEVVLDKKGKAVDYRFLKVNPAFAEQSGMNIKTIGDKTITEVFPDIEERWIERYCNVAISHKPIHFIDYNHNTNRYYDVYAFPITKEKFSMLFRDVTRKHLAEKKLEESEEKYRVCVENANDAILLADLETGIIIEANTKAGELLGWPVEKIIGMHQTQLHSKESGELYDKMFQESGEDKKAMMPSDSYICHQDGRKIPVEISFNVMELKGGKVLQGIFRDITERKRTEEEIQAYQERLRSLASELSLSEERQRHRIATELHDTVSQELAFALTKLQNIRETASGDNLGSLSDICEMVSKVVGNMRNMTFDICSPTLYKFDLETAVSELLDDKFTIRDGINYSFRDDSKAKPLSEDIKIVLFQSIRELVNNIIKHAQAHNVEVDIQRRENTIRITVNDDGVGFNAEELKLPERSRGGFGLFSIAERLRYIGGSFEFQAQPGCGSSFTLEAPLEADAILCKGEDDGGQDINC